MRLSELSEVQEHILSLLAKDELNIQEISEKTEANAEEIDQICNILYEYKLVDFRRGGRPHQYVLTETGKSLVETNE